MVGIGFAIVSDSIGALIVNILIDWVLVGMMWVWTKIGTMLVMKSTRQNEFHADEFAFKCGYGDSLAAVLDSFESSGNRGLWANLASTHPDSDDRIAKLQELGSNYTMA